MQERKNLNIESHFHVHVSPVFRSKMKAEQDRLKDEGDKKVNALKRSHELTKVNVFLSTDLSYQSHMQVRALKERVFLLTE